MIDRRRFLALLTACGAVTAVGPATAESYPNRPIKLIVPFAAGGGSDTTARLIAEHLSRSFGQQVYVENRPGSSGMIGTEAAARSPADGYTVLVASDLVIAGPYILKMNIDPLKELVPVIQVARQPVVLAVHPSLGVNSVAELIDLAKKRPGLGYVSTLASPQHIVPQWFARSAGIKLDLVPYRGGGLAINDLIAGHVKIGSLGSAPLIPHYRSGVLRLLAQATEGRSPSLPEIPTYEEAGFPGLVLYQFYGAFVPAGTPPAIVARLNAGIDKALADPVIREKLLQSGLEPVGGSAEQFSHRLHGDAVKYERLVRELDIKAN